jgi:hypothetical protein
VTALNVPIYIKRTATANNPPASNSLGEGELFAEMANAISPRLWIGVPTAVDATGRRLVVDYSQYLPSSVTPLMDGTASIGAATAYARADHVHPSDTSRAALVSPIFTGVPAAPTATAGTNTVQIATTAFVGTAITNAGVPAPSSTNPLVAGIAAPGVAATYARADHVHPASGSFADAGRNKLHNALFNVQQRGQGPWTTGVYTADRWTMGISGSSLTIQINTASDTDRSQIGDEEASFYLLANCVGTSGAGDQSYFEQRVENVRRLAGKTVTLSFWATAASGTPKLGCSFHQWFGSGGSPSAPVPVNGQSVTLSTTWTRYSLTFTLPSIAGKTLGTNNDTSTFTRFWLSSGANSNVIAGNIGVQSYILWIWGVQLEIGSQATPLEKLDPRIDFANCQRFYQGGTAWLSAYHSAGSQVGYAYSLPVTMRAAPSVALVGPFTSNLSGLTAAPQGAASIVFYGTVTATGGGQFNTNFNASADL